MDALQKDGVKKTGTERALASLVSKGSVTQKTYGKIHIFIIAQDKLELPDPEESQRVDAEIKSLTAEAGGLYGKPGEMRGGTGGGGGGAARWETEGGRERGGVGKRGGLGGTRII